MQKFIRLFNKNKKLVIGLMSGTSLDGVDAVLVEITGSGINTKLKQLKFISYPFPRGMKKLALENSRPDGGNVTDICRLNFLIPLVYVDAIKELCKKSKVPLSKIDLIGSHGQTIHHLPDKKKFFGYTFGSTIQIADPAVIAKKTGIVTIGDFRTGDVALGGQGAPLVPYFDYIMFQSKERNRALLNIGGISNITVLNKRGTAKDVFAFDTGPGNMMIDILTKKYFMEEYDRYGKFAASGFVNEDLFKALIKADRFINKKPPKSTGREYYGTEFIKRLPKRFARIKKEDWLATITNFTAFAVFRNYERFIEKETRIEELFVSGGGAKNKTLMKDLKNYFGSGVKIKNVNKLGISSDAKEAICFAVLANETISGNPSNIPRVTGAEKETILGKICLP